MKERGNKILGIALSLLALSLSSIYLGHATPSEKASCSQDKKNAILFIDKSEIDFGYIVQGESPTATFSVRNDSSEFVRAVRIYPQLKIFSVNPSIFSLGPGEVQNIAITLDSSRLSEPLMSQIAILTDISEEPEALLRVRANIKAVLAFKPALISAGQIAKDASFSGRASLVGTLVEQGKLKNLKIETSTAAIDVEDIASPNYRRGVFLKFVLKPELKAGTFKETITLISENPPIKAVLEILGQKLGIIKVTPDRFSFFPKKGKRPKKLDIIFECEKVFKITKLEDLSGALDLSIKTLEKGRKYRLRAKLKKIPEGGILSVVKVHTDLEEHPLIHIPVIGGGER